MKNLPFLILCLLLLSCHSWESDRMVNGIEYSRFRYTGREQDSPHAYTIGKIRGTAEKNGLVLKHYLHLRGNGTISGGLLAEPALINGILFPADTWVIYDTEGHLSSCGLPVEMTIQGYELRGNGGGVNSPRCSFYPTGELKGFFSAERRITIDGVVYKGGLFHIIRLDRDGKVIEGTPCPHCSTADTKN